MFCTTHCPFRIHLRQSPTLQKPGRWKDSQSSRTLPVSSAMTASLLPMLLPSNQSKASSLGIPLTRYRACPAPEENNLRRNSCLPDLADPARITTGSEEPIAPGQQPVPACRPLTHPYPKVALSMFFRGNEEQLRVLETGSSSSQICSSL
ncbi:hypothetical protein B0T21DRAFT_166126 [Apiosordaria backusii]|uniref:Uncharacterized protein n=1 Tax=Apiosordaria backusii TaxID=314023 RepID=A0AA40BNK5_9PEZI|nr:hypothetical protein B0T21DRAFT_166126 [Apiosordaria backusii]